MFPILEESKALFLKGDFRGYLATVDTFFPDLDYGPLFEPLSALAPDGFDGCTTIAQRVDTGGMVQEITLFDLPGDQGPLSLYMAAGPVEGELTVLLFSFNGKLSVILDKLR